MFLIVLFSCSLMDSNPVTEQAAENISDQTKPKITVEAPNIRTQHAIDPKVYDYDLDVLGLLLDYCALASIDEGYILNPYSSFLSDRKPGKLFPLSISTNKSKPYYLGTFHGSTSRIQFALRDGLWKALTIQDEDVFNLNSLFEIWFGNSLFTEGKHTQEYQHLNVEALENWKPMLPPPDARWRQTTYQDIYDNLFKDFAHLISESYLYLKHNGIDQKSKDYWSVHQSGGNILSHLDDRYGQAFPVIGHPTSEAPLSWHLKPGFGIGFWLRRHLDGSDLALWKIVAGVLSQYDPDWIIELQRKYPSHPYLFADFKETTTPKHVFDADNRVVLHFTDIQNNHNIWIDGIDYGSHALAITNEGLHTITVTQCDLGTLSPTDQNSTMCPCLSKTLNLKAGTVQFPKQPVLNQHCSSDGSLLRSAKNDEPDLLWTETSLSITDLTKELNITHEEGEFGEQILTLNDQSQTFFNYKFRRYQKGHQSYYLITGSGMGGPDSTLYHTFVSPPDIVIGGSFESIPSITSQIQPILLDTPNFTLSLGYNDGVEQVLQIAEQSIAIKDNPTSNTHIPLSIATCNSLYELSKLCMNRDVASLSQPADCPTRHEDYLLNGEYSRTYELAKAHSTFNSKAQQKYCLALCNGQTSLPLRDYQSSVCGL